MCYVFYYVGNQNFKETYCRVYRAENSGDWFLRNVGGSLLTDYTASYASRE